MKYLIIFLVACGPITPPRQAEIGSFCQVNRDCPSGQVCMKNMGTYSDSLGQCQKTIFRHPKLSGYKYTCNSHVSDVESFGWIRLTDDEIACLEVELA